MVAPDQVSIDGAHLTLWFINTDDPAAVLAEQPRADRGFGRKYLAQLNPSWPVTPIGQFPLNRSTAASKGEFYIGGYAGITVVQTWVDDLTKLSDIDPHLLSSAPAHTVYAAAINDTWGYGGIAQWDDGMLKRSLCATRTWIIEDVGLPQGFEADYWSGEKSPQEGALALPFDPIDLAYGAQEAWLGVDVTADGTDIDVVGYAIDGRPEPRVEQQPRHSTVAEQSTDAANKQAMSDYDDYAVDNYDPDVEDSGAEFQQWLSATNAAAKRVGRGVRRRLVSLRDRFRRD